MQNVHKNNFQKFIQKCNINRSIYIIHTIKVIIDILAISLISITEYHIGMHAHKFMELNNLNACLFMELNNTQTCCTYCRKCTDILSNLVMYTYNTDFPINQDKGPAF